MDRNVKEEYAEISAEETQDGLTTTWSLKKEVVCVNSYIYMSTNRSVSLM